MKQIIKQLEELIEFRNYIISGLDNFDERFTGLNNYLNNMKKNPLMDYNAVQIKIKSFEKKYIDVLASIDYGVADKIKRGESLCSEFIESKKEELPPELVNELTENFNAIASAMPAVEKHFAELISLLAVAEKELYQPN